MIFGPVVLQRFRLTRLLSRSANSVVFAGHDASSTDVVVKIALSSEAELQINNEHSFLAGALAGCVGVPTVLGFEVESGQKMLVTSPLGESLKMHCLGMENSQRRALTEEWDGRLCAILRRIHERGVIHRDIKPDNIVVTATGDLVIIDFGCAIEISDAPTATPIGTPHYLADCFRDTGLPSARADFESLAWSLHALDTGLAAYEQQEPHAMLAARPSLHEAAQTSLSVAHVLAQAQTSAGAAPVLFRHRANLRRSAACVALLAVLIICILHALRGHTLRELPEGEQLQTNGIRSRASPSNLLAGLASTMPTCVAATNGTHRAGGELSVFVKDEVAGLQVHSWKTRK